MGDEKQAQMWANIVADNSIGPNPNPAFILSESVKTSFDDEWDNMPAGRTKYIHPAGAVCPFLIDIKDSTSTDEKSGVTPGGGVKFFRTGRSSGNFVILNQ